ncbi:hypothetical protein MRX96_006006 [Rhipicephalus microplus]
MDSTSSTDAPPTVSSVDELPAPLLTRSATYQDQNHTAENYREDYAKQGDPYVTAKRLQKEPDIEGIDHTYSAAVVTCSYGPALKDFFVFYRITCIASDA